MIVDYHLLKSWNVNRVVMDFDIFLSIRFGGPDVVEDVTVLSVTLNGSEITGADEDWQDFAMVEMDGLWAAAYAIGKEKGC